MNISIKFLITISVIVFLLSCSTKTENKTTHINIKTSLGDITILLYNETPLHRDNFIKLVNNHIYDGMSFHRVIKGFMIQSGDPETKSGQRNPALDTLALFTIPSEFNPLLYHKKGALAAARLPNDINPEMKSSGSQFYIVQGKKFFDDELDQAEQKINNEIRQTMFKRLVKEAGDSNAVTGKNLTPAEIEEKASLRMFEELADKGPYKLTEEQRNTYKTTGGYPFLDGTYTVFGEVVSGLDIIDRIADAETGENDKPIADIRIIKMKVVRK